MRQTTLRIMGLTMMAVTSLTVSRADVIQSTVVLPPLAGAYALGGICVNATDRCIQNATVSGFDIVSRTVDSGNELVVVNATWSGDVYTETGGLPDTFIGHLTLPGTVHFAYLGRDPSVNPLGTFTTEITDFAFQGMLLGNTFEIKQDPARTSTGSTTILPIAFVPPIQYSVSSSLEVFGLFSINGGPFMQAPPRSPILIAIPEPASGTLAGVMLAGIIGLASLRHRKFSLSRR